MAGGHLYISSGGRYAYLIGFIDDYSRYVVGLELYRTQTAAQVLEVYHRAIGEYGVPKEMLTDRGRQYTNWCGSTRFERELGQGPGITSALMARRGITGAKAIFNESEISFCHLYHSGCDKDVLIRDLGKTFEMLDMSFKPYPSCRLGHMHIDAVLRLVQEHNIQVEEVQEVIPTACQFVNAQLCTPLEAKKKPNNRTAAQFSLPWVIACVVVRKRVGIHEFTEDALKDRILLDMAAKVNPIFDPLLPDEFAFTPVRIKTKRGTFESMTDYGYGSVQNPMTFEAIEEKFMDCASISVKPILKGNLEKVI